MGKGSIKKGIGHRSGRSPISILSWKGPRADCQRDMLSLGTVDLTGTQATGANGDGLVSTVNDCLDLANVGLPGAIGFTVGVGNILTVNNTLTADTTFCHDLTPPYCGFGPVRL